MPVVPPWPGGRRGLSTGWHGDAGWPWWSRAVSHSSSVLATSELPALAGGSPSPYSRTVPLALVTLRDLLRKQKVTMVEVFKRAGTDRRKTTRADFIHIIKAVRRELKRNKLLQLCPIFLACKPRVLSVELQEGALSLAESCRGDKSSPLRLTLRCVKSTQRMFILVEERQSQRIELYSLTLGGLTAAATLPLLH